MDLNDFFGPKPIVIDLHAENRWEATDELINHLVANHKIKTEHRDAIAVSVRKRESAMSTGIGFGIGIPHTSTNLVYSSSCVFPAPATSRCQSAMALRRRKRVAPAQHDLFPFQNIREISAWPGRTLSQNPIAVNSFEK
jgi:hypothetical protein